MLNAEHRPVMPHRPHALLRCRPLLEDFEPRILYSADPGPAGLASALLTAADLQAEGFDEIVVATKGGYVRPGGRWVSDARPAHLRRACERSLAALGVERIDL